MEFRNLDAQNSQSQPQSGRGFPRIPPHSQSFASIGVHSRFFYFQTQTPCSRTKSVLILPHFTVAIVARIHYSSAPARGTRAILPTL